MGVTHPPWPTDQTTHYHYHYHSLHHSLHYPPPQPSTTTSMLATMSFPETIVTSSGGREEVELKVGVGGTLGIATPTAHTPPQHIPDAHGRITTTTTSSTAHHHHHHDLPALTTDLLPQDNLSDSSPIFSPLPSAPPAYSPVSPFSGRADSFFFPSSSCHLYPPSTSSSTLSATCRASPETEIIKSNLLGSRLRETRYNSVAESEGGSASDCTEGERSPTQVYSPELERESFPGGRHPQPIDVFGMDIHSYEAAK
ncbi:hypothetical protein GWK47_002759 [Chionoecetes opilio]|uniref:Uncharacterized protein n=1 Tax=Chionoecetes opilio TaxID=41210 RepID=A0A8J4XLF2_CHIOP|nr:hypothetical protein GWK47_002759 [Chionoecetes opilio]